MPMTTASEGSGDRDSSASSRCLSGSSGGHTSSTPPHGPWREQPPYFAGPRRQPRDRDPRLELLRDKIRSQARWQASCASLGTSAPSSTSYVYSSSSPALAWPLGPAPAPPSAVLRGKAQRMKSSPCKGEKPPRCSGPGAVAKDRDSESTGVYAWRKGRALARALLGPAPALPRSPYRAPPRDLTPAAELGASRKSRAARTPRTAEPSSGSGCSNHLGSANPSSLTSCDPARTLHSTMSTLRALRQQIQARMEQARGRPRRGPELGQRDLGGRRQPWRVPEAREPSGWPPQAGTKGQGTERAGSAPCGQRHRDPLFRRPRSPPDQLRSGPQRPYSASARWDSWTPRTWPWEPWDPPSWGPRSSPTQCSWSTASTLHSGDRWPPWGPKLAGQRPAPEAPPRVPPPCPKPRAALGHLHSSESLRDFMRQQALARKHQAQQEKALALQAQQLRNQRLQDVYRLQREAVLGTPLPVPCWAAPRVSQTNPGIVTFVPSSAQFSSLGPPRKAAQEWSKVTSGTLLGDQEVPGSFCLCLSHTELLEPGAWDGWDGVSPETRASTCRGCLRSQSLTTRYPHSGVCICLASEGAQRLGARGPLHFQHRQARLQALETMANVLKQRIDILTATLRPREQPDAPGDPGPELLLPSLHLSPAAPRSLGTAQALVPNGGPEASQRWPDMQVGPLHAAPCFLDPQALPQMGHHGSRPRGFTEDGVCVPGEKLLLGAGAPWAPSTCARSLTSSDTASGSLRLDKMPAALGLGLATPCTDQSFGQCGGASGPFTPSFLRTLKLDQQQQEQTLALRSVRAELELWEAQKALEQLLFKQQVQHLAEKHPVISGPGHPWPAASWSPKASRRSHTPVDTSCSSASAASPGRDSTPLCWAPEGGAGSAAFAELTAHGHSPSGEPAARLCTQDRPFLQPSGTGPFARLTWHKLQQELRAKTQDALLRLREMALEEKVRTELAWTDHQQGSPSSRATLAALSTLGQRQQAVLDRLEQQQKEMRSLRRLQRSENRARKLLLEQQRDLALVQRSMARLQQELWVRSRLAQGSHWEVPAPQAVAPRTCPQQEGPTQGSSGPPQPWRVPESPRASQPPGALQSPGVVWDEDSPAESGHPSPAAWEPQDKDSPAESGHLSSAAREPQDELRAPLGQGLPWAPLWPPKQVLPLPQATGRVGSAPAEGQQPLEMQELPVGDAPADLWALTGIREESTQGPDQEGSSGSSGARPETLPTACSPEHRGPGEHRTRPRLTEQEACSPEASAAPEDPGSEPALPGTASGSGSAHALAWPSLPDFQKVSAVLVRLSHTSSPLSDPPDSPLTFSGGSGSWAGSGVSGAPLQSSSLLASPRPESVASSEVSSEVWAEDFPRDPGSCSDPQDGQVPSPAPSAWGPGKGLEASGSSRSDSGPGAPLPSSPEEGRSPLQRPRDASPTSSTHGDPPPAFPCIPEDPCLLPPPPPESEAGTQSHSEDFPPPPEDSVLSPGCAVSPQEAEAPTAPERLLFQGILGPSEAGAHLEEELGDSLRVVGGQCPQPSCCPALPTATPEGRGAVQMGVPGFCSRELPGREEAAAVDLVSTQLTQRILCDTLATLSELPGEEAGASAVPKTHTAATEP